MPKMTRLMEEYPIMVYPSLARAIGLNEALVLQKLHFWAENDNSGVVIGNHRWIYNTYEDWQKQFSFWSVRTVQRVFLSLEERQLVYSKQVEKEKYNRTKYYRINYEALSALVEALEKKEKIKKSCRNP